MPFPPEWSPHDAVWIGFPSAADLWLDDLAPAQAEVAAFARAVWADGHGEEVRLVCADAISVRRARALAPFATVLELPFFDIWLRDTGPLVLSDGRAVDYRGNGWGGKYPSPLDDALAQRLAEQAGLPRVAREMILEGGAIDVDGSGWVVTTEQCLLNPNRNPGLSRGQIESELRETLGVQQVLWLGEGLAGDHTDGHVDNLARFVAPGLLALPMADEADDPNAAAYADAWRRAEAAGLRLVALPSPGRVSDEDGAAIAASYMNFYIGNAAVVVPTYARPNDKKAVEALTALFPGRSVTGLPASHVLTGGGSFHCISQQLPRLNY